MVPKTFHLIWITPPNGVQFSLHHMICVKSAHYHNPDFKIKLHCDKEPTGKFFEQIKSLVEIVNDEIPEEVFGNKLTRNAHKADILRLSILMSDGGVYMDLDVITMRPYHEFLANEITMGLEPSAILSPRRIFGNLRRLNFDVIKYGGRTVDALANGFIVARSDSQFLKDWYEEYRNFDSSQWSYNSVKVPLKMLRSGKYNVTTISPMLCYFPMWSEADLKFLFEESHELKHHYFIHLWESLIYDKYLAKLTPETMLASNTTYCNIAKQYL